jgi:hypothetical protein
VLKRIEGGIDAVGNCVDSEPDGCDDKHEKSDYQERFLLHDRIIPIYRILWFKLYMNLQWQ